jgi:hypothetical protein
MSSGMKVRRITASGVVAFVQNAKTGRDFNSGAKGKCDTVSKELSLL